MDYIIDGILVVSLGVVIYQDFKYRAVSWIVFPVLFVIAIFVALGKVGTIELLESSLINLGMLTLIFAGLTIYFSMKERVLINIINKQIGIADLLLLIVICLLFSPVNFIMYYVASLIVITMGSAVYLAYKKDMKAEIPLAGAFSILLIACLLYAGITGNINFHDDGLVMELLNPFLLTS